MFRFRAKEEGFLPELKTLDAAAYDIRASEDVHLLPYQPVWVPTGLWIDKCLDYSYYLRIAPRSSSFKNLLYVHPGTVDADFPDEIKVGIMFMSNPYQDSETKGVRIEKGTRIAQMFLERRYSLFHANIENAMARTGGFGSTGEKQ